jgi:NAD+ synthetase
MEEIYENIINGMKGFFERAGFEKAVIGLSGGIDSAVCACLAVDALGRDNVIGAALPGPYSGNDTVDLAKELAGNLGIRFVILPIDLPFASMCNKLRDALGDFKGVPMENLQSRLRMCYLMGIANRENALLLDTGNHTENWLGYDTLYGDLAGAVAPIADLTKTEVYEMAEFLNRDTERIPAATIDRKPSAELSDGQLDPFDYRIYSLLVREIAGLITTDKKNGFPVSEEEFFKIFEGWWDKYPVDTIKDAFDRIRKTRFKREQMFIPVITRDGKIVHVC